MERVFAGWLAGLVVVLCIAAAGVGAQEPATQRPFGSLVEEWQRAIDLAGRELVSPGLSDERAEKLKQRLSEIRVEAMELQANTRLKLAPLENRLEALGPPPAEAQPPEFEAIAEQRRKINEDIATFDGHIKQAALIIGEADELIQTINVRSLGQVIDTLLKSFPSPLSANTLGVAAPEFLQVLGSIGSAPRDWWRAWPAEHRNASFPLTLGLIGVLAIFIRVLNPAFPEGMMLAILFMNVFAATIDHYVVQANVRRRKARYATP